MTQILTKEKKRPAPFTIETLAAFIDFQHERQIYLDQILPQVEKQLIPLANLFYERVMDNLAARKIILDSNSETDFLKKTLRHWIMELVASPLDEKFFKSQYKIGIRHVEVALPHSFMVLGICVIRSAISKIIFEYFRKDIQSAFLAQEHLNQKLDISLGIMLRSYQKDHDAQNKKRVLLENEHILTLGRMSASIAHEIKNPLAGINGAVQVLRKKLPEEHPDQSVMDAILEQIKRLSGTVNDLLDFSRPIKLNLQSIRLSEIIDSLEAILKNDPDYKMSVHYLDEKTQDLPLMVDPIRLQNVFYNLFLNSNDACPGQGRITLSSKINDKEIHIFIQDEGPGIPEEWRGEIFKPFATNKVNGTGLGLAICQKIVTSHGGRIEYIASKQGACFCIQLSI
jgi:signal transduction histidine kinase